MKATPSPFSIHYRPEALCDPSTKEQLQRLLSACFPGFFHDRIYFKQLPHGRLLASLDGVIIGQVALEYRAIRIGETPLQVMGLIDVCVHPDHRRSGVGGLLLDAASDMAMAAPNPIDGLLLFADEHGWYQRHGFQLLQRPCRWFGIDEHRSLGLIERQVDDCIMLKPIHTRQWPDGEIDLLGTMF